jgi:hypothetical protein
MRIIILAAVLTLAGCATTANDWHWYKAGATQQDLSMDDGQCRAQAFGVPGMNLFQVAMVLQSCMQGKGWEKRAG